MSVGYGDYKYELVSGWGRLPPGYTFNKVSGVAIDSRDRVYTFSRTDHPVMVFDSEGNFLYSWGEQVFTRPHGIFIGSDDAVYCTDDKDHTLRKFTPEGKLLRTWGTKNDPSDTGYDGKNPESIQRGALPFNRPTGGTIAPTGEMYITDGYGNARVHKFAPDGQLLLSWGEPGDGAGQFHAPHAVKVDPRGRVLVVDKENSRIQIFSADGEFITQWRDLYRANDVEVDANGMVHILESFGRVTVLNLDGQVQVQWGKDEPNAHPDEILRRAHTMALDSQSNVYVGAAALDFFKKFVRR